MRHPTESLTRLATLSSGRTGGCDNLVSARRNRNRVDLVPSSKNPGSDRPNHGAACLRGGKCSRIARWIPIRSGNSRSGCSYRVEFSNGERMRSAAYWNTLPCFQPLCSALEMPNVRFRFNGSFRRRAKSALDIVLSAAFSEIFWDAFT